MLSGCITRGTRTQWMYNVGPVHCASTGVDWRLAFDDADGYRDRYPGLNDTSTGFPPDAVCDP
jgi:hypothetical protein